MRVTSTLNRAAVRVLSPLIVWPARRRERGALAAGPAADDTHRPYPTSTISCIGRFREMSTSRTTDFSSIEMSVAVEPTLSNRTELPIDHKAPRPAQQQLKSKLLFPVKFTLTVVVFLIVIAYIVPVAVLQGIGMLGLGLTMPKIMIYVYPSRLGKIHVLVLWAESGGHACDLQDGYPSQSCSACRKLP